MLYADLKFNPTGARPLILANFATSLNGVVEVNPQKTKLSSDLDRAVMDELRACSDAVVHGTNMVKLVHTAKALGHARVQELRRKLGKNKPIYYVAASRTPDREVIERLSDPADGVTPVLATHPPQDNLGRSNGIETLPYKTLAELIEKLQALGCEIILLECGPSLFDEFLKQDLVDHLFLTLAPKIFGHGGKTLSFAKEDIPIIEFGLVSAKPVGNEVYLHYERKR